MSNWDIGTLTHTLNRANNAIRASRPGFSPDHDVDLRKGVVWLRWPRRRADFYQIWFRTRGCTFDRAGQCSMCNYGVGPEIDTDRVAAALDATLATVAPGSVVYVSPSGSLLDDREVPPDLRGRIIESVAARRPAAFTFETRPEFCEAGKLDEIQQRLGETSLACHFGVESWDPMIRAVCHLKPTRQTTYVDAVRLLRARRIAPIANIALGALGLSEAEALADATASVRGTRASGFTIQMLFPLSAKRHTLLGWARGRGLWSSPSLWTLVAALGEVADENLAEDGTGDLDISWFNPDLGAVVAQRPDSCGRCRPMLIDTLRAFRLRPASDTLRPATAWNGCDCRTRTIQSDDSRTYLDRLTDIAEAWLAEAGLTPPVV